MDPAPDLNVETAIPRRPRPLAELFHENTKLNPVNDRAFAEELSAVGQDPALGRAFARAAKSYPGHRAFPLRRDFSERSQPLFRVLRRRRTRREFGPAPLSAETLARILWFSAAETGSMPTPAAPDVAYRLRAAPSAGALHSIEVYPLLFRTEGLPPGIYHYNAPEHSAELLFEGDCLQRAIRNLLAPDLAPQAAAVLVLTAVLDRVCLKYGERGYRFVHLDAGHLAQNVLLVCEELGVSAVPLGGFHDDGLAGLLALDSREEIVVYPILLGSR